MRIGIRILRQLAVWKWWLLLGYSSVLLCSDIVRWQSFAETIDADVSVMSVRAIKADKPSERMVRLVYKEYVPPHRPNAPVVGLLQGSPGDHRDFARIAPQLAEQYRVIAPDLPGFGSSSHNIPDYSNRAHAQYVLEMLDQLQVSKAHFVGFSMGGGVALNIADIAPARVESLTMLSGIGVQELELLGNYYLNHSIHGAQLASIWFFREAIPHFGWLDRSMLDVSYARNFYDTDQRPLRSFLANYDGPMLIIHGLKDIMVPVEVAREDYRLVPQSELIILPDENHFYVFSGSNRLMIVASLDFFHRVEMGQAPVKATAERERLEQASAPFDPAANIPKAMGPTALLIFGLLAFATLITEDLTCVWAGVLAAEGRISFAFAAIACLFGIFIGDILLFLAGRLLGRSLLRIPPFNWFVRASDVQRGSHWFQRRGMAAILLSRFLPGTRLPTYFAAGLLDTSFLKFTFYFFIAAAAWTPMLVGTSMLLGREVIESALMTQHSLLLRLVISALFIFVIIRLFVQLASLRGRRLLLGRWRRLIHWEFWPPWAFYPPVASFILYLGLKYRSLTLFTAANPGIEEGGFIGESKSEILQGLSTNPESLRLIASFTLIEGSLDQASRVVLAYDFMRANALTFPVVLKPDAGERGSGVAVVKSDTELNEYLQAFENTDIIIQEYAPGLEFGVFYYRFPESDLGHIFSITKKLFPAVVGDGESTLEELILQDERACAMARIYCEAQMDRLLQIPAKGDSVQLVEIGTHCRGSIFLDGSEIETNALGTAIDRLAKGFDGFFFGRFDIRTPSLTAFQHADNFKVVELNGVTSEATHIYDPQNSLFAAYRVLFNQWRLAFEIGAENRKRGCKPASLLQLARLVIKKYGNGGERSGGDLRPIEREAESASPLAHET